MKRNTVSDILGAISVIAIFAGCVEGLDGSLTFWTIICLSVAAVCGYASKRLCDPPCMTRPRRSDAHSFS